MTKLYRDYAENEYDPEWEHARHIGGPNACHQIAFYKMPAYFEGEFKVMPKSAQSLRTFYHAKCMGCGRFVHWTELVEELDTKK